MPQHFLAQAGVTPDQFQGRPGFSGSHDATIALVQSGAYEAGALNSQVWKAQVKEGRVDTSKVRVIWTTPTYVDYHWVARPDLNERFGKGFTRRLKTALIEMRPIPLAGARFLSCSAPLSSFPRRRVITLRLSRWAASLARFVEPVPPV